MTGDHGANNGVGSGTIDISNTGSIQYAIQTATGIARDNLDNANTIMITDYQPGNRVEMRVDEYGQYGAKFPAESRDAMTYIIDSPDAISAYNEAGYSPAASLLADLFFYGHDLPTDRALAAHWLRRVVELTDEAEAGDAFVRARALQKLG